MRVNQTQRATSRKPAGAARGAGSAGPAFQPSRATEARKAGAARAPVAVGSLDAIVALQAVDDASERRRKAVWQGSEVLDRLEEIKIAILSGQLSRARLAGLQAVVRRYEEQDLDPELADLLRQIDLRARVELAKHDKSAA